MIQFYIPWEEEGAMMKIWNKNIGPDFIKKIQDSCVHEFFFLKLIIWNIDIHTCLLDSTYLCPHLLYLK
jgi:hypothetical protein